MFAVCCYRLQSTTCIFSLIFSTASHCRQETAAGTSKIAQLIYNRSKIQAQAPPFCRTPRPCPPALSFISSCLMIDLKRVGPPPVRKFLRDFLRSIHVLGVHPCPLKPFKYLTHNSVDACLSLSF